MTREEVLARYRASTKALIRYRTEVPLYWAYESHDVVRCEAVDAAIALADANCEAGLPWHTDAYCGGDDILGDMGRCDP